MGLVLELEQPFLLHSVHVHIHENAARVVLLALFQIVEQALLPEVARAYGSKFHKAEALAFASQFLAHLVELAQLGLELFAHEGIVHGDGLELGGEGGVAAVVTPIGVEYPQLCLARIAALPAEVCYNFREVVGVHRQAPFPAEVRIIPGLHLDESAHISKRLHVHRIRLAEPGEILGAGLHGIDEVMANGLKVLFGHIVVKNKQTRALDSHVCRRVYEVHALHGGAGPLVELARYVFHGQIFLSLERAFVADTVGHSLAEHCVAAFLEEFIRKSEEVIDIHKPQGTDVQRKVFVELIPETLRLNLELRILFYEDAMCFHC